MPQQSAKPFVADNRFAGRERFINFRPSSGEWLVVQGLMRTYFVVKFQIRRYEMIEMLFTEDDEEIQTLVFERFTPAFDKGILIWRLRCCQLNSTANVLENLIEFSDVHAIAVADEMLNPQVCLAGLLDESISLANHPFAVRLKTTPRAKHSSGTDMDES